MYKRNYAKVFLVLVLGIFSACDRAHKEQEITDVVLIGGGIMSATLGSLLHELDPDIKIDAYEKLDAVGRESSAAWNNAGTGHAAFAELNYTPANKDGSINLSKAIEVSEAFEVSKSYWAYLASTGALMPRTFINNVPHLSFVFGEDNVKFLKQRFLAMTKHPLFFGMEYSEDHQQIKSWVPLLMSGRSASQSVACTRMQSGVDVDFGALTASLFKGLAKSVNFNLHMQHAVEDLHQNADKTWTVVVRDQKSNQKKSVRAKFVFVGAGGSALTILQKSGIDEASGFGGFPVGGAWLISERDDLIEQHDAKVYGMAKVGSPPMSVPHLDTRYIDGKKALLFGPFATFSTKFLKSGSWSDLFFSVNRSNIMPMLHVGVNNFNLVRYLMSQVILDKNAQIEALKEYFPDASANDWRYELAGQRVQVIKKDQTKGGVLQFGTELVGSSDHSLVALLGASPGASTAVMTMLHIIETSFAKKVATKPWREKLVKMIPSYGQKLAENEKLIREVRARNRNMLALSH